MEIVALRVMISFHAVLYAAMANCKDSRVRSEIKVVILNTMPVFQLAVKYCECVCL